MNYDKLNIMTVEEEGTHQLEFRERKKNRPFNNKLSLVFYYKRPNNDRSLKHIEWYYLSSFSM